jgi:hypothetical protein
MNEEETKKCTDIGKLKNRLSVVQGQIELDHQDFRALDRDLGMERDLLLDRLEELGVSHVSLGFRKIG